MAGQETWEEAEERFQQIAAEMAIEKCGLKKKDIRYVVAGDLLGQLIASSFGLMNLDIPIFGVYGACSTMGESLAIGSMLVDGGFADRVVALTSSHFASAEKQFRFPLGYGNQRPQAATWTVTGSGAVVLSSQFDTKKKLSRKTDVQKIVQVRGVTTGKIVDYGVKDSMNMGACMAPAAADVIAANLNDFQRKPEDYDQIITGDLGEVGRQILLDILQAKGYDIADRYIDCGIEIYRDDQNVQSGGSGCGCSAVMLTGYILQKLKNQEWKRVLFVPTGALLSPVSFNEGKSVPGIAHAVILESAGENDRK
ncbi:stage V sporulation protein AD [Roseburia sp. CAG:380]|nr:stage V sporulation protein AD [Roseburia sp. CAG:380]